MFSTQPITKDEAEENIEIFYDSDLDILDEEQEVFFSGRTYSEYEADDSNELTAVDGFIVTYLNPCYDPNFTTITAPD